MLTINDRPNIAVIILLLAAVEFTHQSREKIGKYIDQNQSKTKHIRVIRKHSLISKINLSILFALVIDAFQSSSSTRVR